MLPDSAAGESMQAALVAAIRGPAAATATASAFSALLLPHGASEDDLAALATSQTRVRFGLYRELVQNRFRGALEVSIPRTLARAGASRIEADLDEFMALRASRSPYLRDVAGEFVDFAVERWRSDPKVPRYLPELARHELLSFEIGAAQDDPPSCAQEISVVSRLRFQRATRLVRHAYAVHLLPEDLEDDCMPEQRDCSLLAYRDVDGCAQFLELSAMTASLLTRLMRGEPLGAASTGSLADVGLAVDDTALAEIAVLLDDLELRGALLGAAE
jgi:hypothetical protein